MRLDLFGQPIKQSISELKNVLAVKIEDMKSRTSQFLNLRNRLAILTQRSSALSKLPQTASYSTGLLSAGFQLVEAQRLLERDSARFTQDANNTMTQLQTDPFWIKISSGNVPQPSWDNVNRQKFMAETILNVSQQLDIVIGRLDEHLSRVNDFESRLKSVEAVSPMRPQIF